jgi:spore maturation protein CgeB
VLNITRSDFFGAETGVNLRIFEALAAGCFLLTDHCEELAELFAVGKEIETYRSSAELGRKRQDYYLNNQRCASGNRPQRPCGIPRCPHMGGQNPNNC